MMHVEIFCEAILFDMDGTLTDSNASVVRQWQRWAGRHALDLARVLELSHGRRTIETIQAVAPHLAAEEELATFLAEEEQDQSGVTEVPGAKRLLDSLPRERWGVVTSASRRITGARFQICGFPHPPALVTADDVEAGKPDPACFLAAARHLGFAPADCLVIEDAPAGIAGARNAGMQVIGVTTTYSKERLGVQWAVADLRALRIDVRDRIRIEILQESHATPAGDRAYGPVPV